MRRSCFSLRWTALLLVAVVACVVRPVCSADTNLYSSDTWSLVDAKAVMAAAAEITVANYPDCDEATVEKKMERVYRADGTGESQDEGFVKALTEKGRRNNRTIALNFMLPYSRSEV